MASGVFTSDTYTTAQLPFVKPGPHEYLLPFQFSEPYTDPETGHLVDVEILAWELKGDYASVIAAELRNAAPARVGWRHGGVDRSYEFGVMLASKGARTLADVRVKPVDQADANKGFCFDIRGKSVGHLQYSKDGNIYVEATFRNDKGRMKAGTSPRGSGRTHYYLSSGEKGLCIIPVWEDTSDRNILALAAGLVIGVVLPVVSINFAASLGATIVGQSTAAAYPALAQAVGNVAVSTALSGGDIESAIKGTVLGMVGSAAGAFAGAQITDLTGLEVVGKIAAGATRALITGGDIQMAALGVAAQYGLGKLPELVSQAYDASSTQSIEAGKPMDLFDSEAIFGADSSASITGDIWSQPALGADWGLDWGQVGSDATSFDFGSILFPADSQVPVAPDVRAPESSTFSLTPVINTVTQAASAAIKLYAQYKAMTEPPRVNTQARTINADGSVRATTSDGYVQTRYPDGRVTRNLPPVGQAFSTIDGFVIINNGDGTFTRINSAGQRQTVSYSAQGADLLGSGSSAMPLALLAGGAALLLLARK